MTVPDLLNTLNDLSPEERQRLLSSALEGLTLAEVLSLVSHLEQAWEVEARPVQGQRLDPEPEPEVAASTYAVELTAAGEQRVAVIRVLRELLGAMSIGEARTLLGRAPVVLLDGLDPTAAAAAQAALEAAGAEARLVAS